MKYQVEMIQAIFTSKESMLAHALSRSNQMLRNKQALSVYHNNYIENGIRALSIGFPSVYGFMHPDDFRKLAREYLLLYPKTCFDWADYGEHLANYMYELEAISELPFLPELAELDWRLLKIERVASKAFDADSFGLLQSSNINNIRFEKAPGLQLYNVYFPLVELYQLIHEYSDANIQNIADPKKRKVAREHKETLVKETNELVNIAIENALNNGQTKSILLWRKDYKGVFEYCTGASEQAFDYLLQNNSVEKVLSPFGENQTAIAEWLQGHIQSRKIYAIINL